jgi:hypothetical protein
MTTVSTMACDRVKEEFVDEADDGEKGTDRSFLYVHRSTHRSHYNVIVVDFSRHSCFAKLPCARCCDAPHLLSSDGCTAPFHHFYPIKNVLYMLLQSSLSIVAFSR